MKRRTTRRRAAAGKRHRSVVGDKAPVAAAPERLMSPDEHEFVRRSVALLSDLHGARGHVSRRSMAVLSRLEANVLKQLEALQVSARAGAKKLSGASWDNEFRTSKLTSDLKQAFATAVDKFIAAMRAGGASVVVSATYRPVERAYLMHYSWKVSQGEIAAGDVPAMTGVDIEWVHATDAQSVQAAKDMVAGYQIVKEPALTSRHTEKRAIDMTISWSGTLKIAKADGTSVSITTTPRNGENADLVAVGAGYGVIKATFAGDPPHWSDDGH